MEGREESQLSFNMLAMRLASKDIVSTLNTALRLIWQGHME